ncbi:MAG: hypothetical protein AAF823_10785 [Planctomycetota bacterium]
MQRLIVLSLALVMTLSGVPAMAWGTGCCVSGGAAEGQVVVICPLCPGGGQVGEEPEESEGQRCPDTAVCCQVVTLNLTLPVGLMVGSVGERAVVFDAGLRALGDVDPPTEIPKLG